MTRVFGIEQPGISVKPFESIATGGSRTHHAFPDDLEGPPRNTIRFKGLMEVALEQDALVVYFKKVPLDDLVAVSYIDKKLVGLAKYLIHQAKDGTTKIILDLSRVIYVTSAGIGSLISLQKRSKNTNRELVLVGVDKVAGLREKLGFSSIEGMFKYANNVDEALSTDCGK